MKHRLATSQLRSILGTRAPAEAPRDPAVAGGQAPGLAWQPQRREQIHVLQLYHAFHDDQILQFVYNTCYDNAVQQRRFILIAMSSLPLKIGPWD